MSDEPSKQRKVKPREPMLTPTMVGFAHFYMGQAKGDPILAAELAGYAGDRDKLSETAGKLLKHPAVQAEMARIRALPIPMRPGIATRVEVLEKMTSMLRLDDKVSKNHQGICFAAKFLFENLTSTEDVRQLLVILRERVSPQTFREVLIALSGTDEPKQLIDTTGEST